ncbi:glutaredoxin domain-containing protein [Tsukamurella hominis]|uniref:glutaredoxin domain-containing protein n=1 Tax=Tsukamurella hominis TaxID=1970232 RepID=UPI0039EA0EA8
MTVNDTTIEVSITVYSKPACVQCTATYKALDKHVGADHYEVVDISQDDAARELVVGMGYLQAPVVLVRNSATGELVEHWSGFRPDRAKACANRRVTAPASRDVTAAVPA